MCQFATAKDDNDLDAIAVFEKATNFADFNVKIVVADFESKFHLLEFGLFFASFFALFGLFFHALILEFTPINNFHYRRICIGGNFH